jgi:GGDEF domain-containing protein
MAALKEEPRQECRQHKESHMLDSAMDGLRRSPITALRSGTHITVFPDRAHFEAALRSTLNHAHGPCAMLHVALAGDHADAVSMSRRMLNLAGSTLRACMRAGEAVYLGHAEFAVLLHGVDAREVVNYARTVMSIVSGFRVMWEGELLSAEARIGGVLFGDGEMDTALLAAAEEAGRVADGKLGCKLHLVGAALAYAQRPASEETLSQACA